MGSRSSTPDQALMETLRRQRAELRGSMSALELALAGPAPGGQVRWAERVHVALVELSADFRAHVDVTERHEGLYVDLLDTAPRLSDAVARLAREHTQTRDLVDDLLTRARTSDSKEDVDKVRDQATMLLGMLVRHRQRGSDLVYEAYELDVGGET